MARNASNKLLHKAKKSKSDEFYTQYIDIESELKHYENQFNNKVVYCNCDDPQISNFYKYFVNNFHRLGLKKVIASCYKENKDHGRKFTSGFYYEYAGEITKSDIPSEDDLIYFRGDGDFRSDESVELLQKSDIVVTNPPFSLFREFVDQIEYHKKEYLIIGNVNAITYKNIFELIKSNQSWLGINLGRGISGFIVPKHYELYGTETKIDEFGNRIVSPNNCLWLTNLDTSIRHVDLPLSHTYRGNEDAYPYFDNYDGINVNKTKEIPLDFMGDMGVPITFLHKYNPSQFEIIKFRKGDDEKDLSVNGKCPYFRILIRRKK